MLLRAKQSAQINLKDQHGKLQSHFIKGPEFADDSSLLMDGEVVDVGPLEQFGWINPLVWECVRELSPPIPERGIPGVYEVVPYPKQKKPPPPKPPQEEPEEATQAG